MLTDTDLDEIEARADKATKGPWEQSVGVYYDPDGDDDCWFGRGPTIIPMSRAEADADASFIAASRTDVPALAKEVRRLRRVEAAARTLCDSMAEFPDDHAVWGEAFDGLWNALAESERSGEK